MFSVTHTIHCQKMDTIFITLCRYWQFLLSYLLPNLETIDITRGGACFTCPTPCLVTIVDDRGYAICIKLTDRAPNVHAHIKSHNEKGVKFKGALFWATSHSISNHACGICARNFQGRSRAISTPSTWLSQSANASTHYFSHRFCGATCSTSDFAYWIQPFRHLHAVTCKPPMFVQLVIYLFVPVVK